MHTAEQYDQLVNHETTRLMCLQVNREEAIKIIDYVRRKADPHSLMDSVTIDACQKIIKIEDTPL